MRYAETGYSLEVDLSTGNIEKILTNPGLTEEYLGGLGINARILWDRVPPDVDPLSPENIIIFSAGLLGGTIAPSANRLIVSTFSPQTHLMAYSMMGGFWAPELKFAGYDRVIIKGKADGLVYLWINNGTVEIRDASHLQGKSTYETAELLRQELKEPKAQVVSIGLAGENQVYFASIETHRGSASRLGVGAVMGSKGLKAIAVRGTQDINIARPLEFYEGCKGILEYIRYRQKHLIKGVPVVFGSIGFQLMAIHDERWHTNSFSWGNARIRRKDFWNERIEQQWTNIMENARKRLISCYNCPMQCAGIVKLPGFPTYVMKCYSKLTYVMGAMADDLDFGLKIASKAQHYGVDGFTAPQVMAFAVELYENGILTDKDLPNFPKDNRDRFFYLLDRIVRREGIGDILAEGVYWAAKKIGKGAENFDHNTTKKHEQVPIKLGKLNPIFFLMYATGEKSNITQIEGQIPQAPLPTRELREEFIKDWIQVPTGKEKRFKQFILEWGDEGKRFPFWPSIDLVCELVEWQETMHYIDDSAGICTGVSSFPMKPPYHIHNYPKIISSASGFDIDEDSLWTIAKRTRTLIRAINVRRGLRRKDDRPPEDHWKKRFPEYEQKLLDEYYRFKGWNREGIPTEETLKTLGMGFVAEDLIRRGILRNKDEDF